MHEAVSTELGWHGRQLVCDGMKGAGKDRVSACDGAGPMFGAVRFPGCEAVRGCAVPVGECFGDCR